MNNPFNLSEEKLIELLLGYDAWLKSDPKEEKYPEESREKSNNIREEFLNTEVLPVISDEVLYDKIFKYSRNLEGPVHMRLGEERLREALPDIRRNLVYIMTSGDTPFIIAQNILDGKYRIEVFAKAFWTPILLAKFPDELPNWNNKTEKFFKKFDIRLSTSKLSIADRYKMLSDAFAYLSSLKEGHDFFTINHLMHYGTVVHEGVVLIDKLIGKTSSDPVTDIVRKYKEKIKKEGIKDELYKWKLLKKYLGRPDVKNQDFASEIKSIDFSNLMYPIAIGVKNHIANDLPEEYRNCFIQLFNEEEDLKSRINIFIDNTFKVYRKLEAKMPHHHDERTTATFLTYHEPEKYTFYKDSYYKKYHYCPIKL